MLYFQLCINKYLLDRSMFWNFILIFCHNGFLLAFVFFFFVFNLYTRRLSYTENLLCIIFCIIWVESPVAIYRGSAMSYFLLPPVFSFHREYILFCLRNFSFTVTYSVCNFQSMKSPVELNSLLSKLFCYITWFVISSD